MSPAWRQFLLGSTIVGSVLAAAGVALALSIADIDWSSQRAGRSSPEASVEPLTGVALGRTLFTRNDCRRCHGRRGQGGVENRNYIGGTIPALDVMAERLFLWDPEDAEWAIAQLESGADLETFREDPPFRAYNRFLPQLDAVRTVIRNGSTAGKVNPDGPEPDHMPAWSAVLAPSDIDAVIAYLISLYAWEDS